MNVSDELMEHEIRAILNRLDIPLEKKPDSDGWISLSSPLREDKNPSFRLNISSGAWMDHGTGDKGDVINLVSEMTGKNDAEAVQLVKGILSNDYTPEPMPRPEPKPDNNQPFWTGKRKSKVQESHTRLRNEPEHPLIKMIYSRDVIPYSQLIKYHCGIIHYLKHDWLLFPYRTGAQLYRRADGNKIIRMIKGSKPSQSFFGVRQCQLSPILNITKSPRECMALDYHLNHSEKVIGLCSGEHITNFDQRQVAFIEQSIRTGVRSIRLFLDTATPTEKKRVQVIADLIRSIANRTTKQIIRIAIH